MLLRFLPKAALFLLFSILANASGPDAICDATFGVPFGKAGALFLRPTLLSAVHKPQFWGRLHLTLGGRKADLKPSFQLRVREYGYACLNQ